MTVGAHCSPVSDRRLKNEDFPTFGRPVGVESGLIGGIMFAYRRYQSSSYYLDDQATLFSLRRELSWEAFSSS